MNAQQLIIEHLIPITMGIIVLWIVYRLLFSNSNRLQFNRLLLISAMLFSLTLPFIGLQMGQSAPQMATLKQNLFDGTMLAEITITPEGETTLPEAEVAPNVPQKAQMNGWQILGGIYLIGVGVMTLLFLFKIGKLVALILRSPKEKREGYTAVFTGKEQGSFSFLRYAFFPDENVAPDIVRHERSHIAHGHSWDVLFAEVMMILQWFNPFIYLYKKELQSLHEYQADRDVVATGIDKRNYMMLILQQCTAADFSGMSNNFSLILTKKRIKMITKNEKAKGLWWRLLATLPVLAILLIANTKVTAQEQKVDDKPLKIEMGQFEIYDDDGAPMQLKDTVFYYEDGSYIKFESSEAHDPITGEMRKTFKATTCKADGTPNPDVNFTIREIEKHGDTMMYRIDPFVISADKFDKIKITTDEDINVKVKHQSNDSIFQVVEEMPRFPGGEQALLDYVGKSIVYPEAAKEKEIQGRVFVGFVVEKDGSIGEVKLLRGIGGGCDEEAVRVIKSMPKWQPGKMKGEPVRVNYQMPIFFKLNDESKQPVNKSGESKVDMKPDKNGVYQIVEEMPSFPSGEPAMMEYIAKNIKYPQEARDKDIEGRVFIGMVIEKDGSVSNVRVLRGIGGGCDEEAVRVISSMPKWKPGKVGGEPVPVSYMLPVNFKLQEKQSKKK